MRCPRQAGGLSYTHARYLLAMSRACIVEATLGGASDGDYIESGGSLCIGRGSPRARDERCRRKDKRKGEAVRAERNVVQVGTRRSFRLVVSRLGECLLSNMRVIRKSRRKRKRKQCEDGRSDAAVRSPWSVAQ
jgi:hypothetical protein